MLSGFTRVLDDGVVVNPLQIGEDVLADLGRTIQPTVFIGEHVEESDLPAGSDYVRTDNEAAAHDDLARGALLGLHGLGIDVPERVSVIGHDNILEAPFTSPPLTTIDPDQRNLAATVLDLLLERIAGHEGPPRVIEAPYRLVERGSTAPSLSVLS